MKDIGEADVIFGIRIKHESNGIAISQSHYIEKVLKKFNYFDCTPSWLGILLGGGAISWASKKQTCITGSIMEFKFVALAATGKEAGWLRNLILKIPLWSKPIAPISIRFDSAATFAKAYSQMYNGKPRHLCVRHSMIHELITNEVKSIEFVSLTGSLNARTLNSLLRKLGDEVWSPSEHPKKKHNEETSTNLAWTEPGKYSGEAGMSKDTPGPESLGELRRSWKDRLEKLRSSSLRHSLNDKVPYGQQNHNDDDQERNPSRVPEDKRSARTRIPHFIAEHKPKTYPHIEPKVQRKRSIAPDRMKVVKEEVAEWLKAGIVKRVYTPCGFANPVP
ncbi:hypothetical protein Tco_1309770 [Tanacetum coccineum]